MAVAVAAGNNCWRYYKGGILGNASSCRGVFNTRLDHAVTLVAYTAAVDGEGASQEIVEPTCETTTELSCRKAKRNEKKSGTCRYSNEIMKEYKDRRGRTKKACCVEYETETCDEVAPVTDDGGEVAYWTIQNQWATGWGEAGLMRLEVTGGKGVSGIN